MYPHNHTTETTVAPHMLTCMSPQWYHTYTHVPTQQYHTDTNLRRTTQTCTTVSYTDRYLQFNHTHTNLLSTRTYLHVPTVVPHQSVLSRLTKKLSTRETYENATRNRPQLAVTKSRNLTTIPSASFCVLNSPPASGLVLLVCTSQVTYKPLDYSSFWCKSIS